ncbi:MAG: valyl-tRNA synthetase [Candidatus Paceibacter sp.]|jgi:valyl-tRNA synthetase|nr:valyl-tRNA synthetase [Candidatus Paceibacter sp.]
MNDKFLKPYDPQATEDAIYKKWEESGYFNPDKLPGDRTEPFTIVLPPPNVTGVLHLGHAYEDTLQDAIIRFERMRGKKTLWIPGTDSAAIATQARVEKNIQKDEGKSRHDLGRDELVKRVHEFAKNSENTIISQVKKMGSSLDWSRYAYTLDEPRYKAVMTAFVNMYNAGLIYQGGRIVNWDPKGQTTISDDEIEYKEEKTKFYYFKYGPFVIGTARPETKFGDKYVVMHPDDTRYAEYKHGQKIDLEWINGPITATVVKDSAIDMEFGTGVMTITPWHSGVDFEIAERHGLDKEQIIDKYGKLLPIAGEFAGMKITEARPKIVEKLRAKGLIEKEEDYTHNVATAERSGGMIEPQIMKQWWVGVNKAFTLPHSEIEGIASGSVTTLKEIMRKSVETGAVQMPQERFSKSYFHWIDNLHDWCISRQIWFGHRIPVWYKGNEIFCGLEAPQEDGWEQEHDVLDTWFSSALWTFSTLGWPDSAKASSGKPSDLQMFHPTSFMSPAYEILNLWVSRMIMMAGFHLGQVPFKTVLIHGIVRDKQGRKFSKSLGNGIDPLDMIAKYGADALRMGLMVGTAIGNDIQFDESKVRGYKNFANKLWNITRFILSSHEYKDESVVLTDADKAHLENLNIIIADVTKDIEEYRLYMATEKLYHYVWHELADVIIEDSKPILSGEDATTKASRQQLLLIILETCLKALHPFMPFVTEEIWSMLPGKKDLLMVETWPIDVTQGKPQ